MSHPAPQHPPDPDAVYAEDRSALRWPLVLHAIGWPFLIVIAALSPVFTHSPASSLFLFFPVMGFVLSMGTTGLVINWPTGIRIDAGGVRIGGIRRAGLNHPHGHHHAGRRQLPPVTAQRGEVFFCPWNGVQRIEVITGRRELRDLAAEGRDTGLRRSKRAGAGRLWAPYMTAALVITVDLAAAQVPPFREPDTRRPWFRMPHLTRYYTSPVWLAPTRHPDALRATLAQLSAIGPATRT